MKLQVNITSRFKQAIEFIFRFDASSGSVRNAWIDYAKGIAIVFVVYRHVIFGLKYSGASINTFMMDANEMLYGFRMPLFFFLAGLFYAGSVKKRGERNYFISKFNTLLYVYLLWSLLQLTLQLIFSEYTNSKYTFANYLDLLLHPRRLLQLWYLFALFNVSILYMITDRFLKFGPYLQIATGLAFLLLKPYVGDISTLSDIMLHYIYFCIGHLAAPIFFTDKIKQSLTSPLKILMLMPFFLVTQYLSVKYSDMNILLYSILAMMGGLIVIMLSFILEGNGKLRFLRILGNYSLYVYLLHISIIFLLRTLLITSGIITNIPLATLILMTGGIFLSIVVYRFCLLIHLKFLFKGPLKETTGENELQLINRSIV